MIISTHSDTMAGKLNNIILLSRMKNIAERNKKNVMVYEFVKNQEGKVKVSALEFMSYPRIGYEFDRFNENIDQLYDESNSIMENE